MQAHSSNAYGIRFLTEREALALLQVMHFPGSFAYAAQMYRCMQKLNAGHEDNEDGVPVEIARAARALVSIVRHRLRVCFTSSMNSDRC